MRARLSRAIENQTPMSEMLPMIDLLKKKSVRDITTEQMLSHQADSLAGQTLHIHAVPSAADVKDMQRHVQTFLSRVRLTDHVVFVVDKDKLPAFSGLSSTNVHFVANGEKLGLVRLAEITSQTIRPGIDAWRRVRISASGRLPFALDTLESLQRLENDLPEGTVTCYLIAEILGNVAIRVSLKDLIEFIRFRDHLIAIQA
jgi:hypothetical protein